MKRVTLFCGHYGSGKSNIAVNYAEKLAGSGLKTALADIDIVNPYFRSADSKEELEKAGVQVVALPFANSNVDLPALPQEVYGLVQRRDIHAVLDVGGDDRGALALGRFAPYILEENDYEMIFVANFFRPLTRNAQDALEVMREIEAACGMQVDALVNNTHCCHLTEVADVLAGAEMAREVSEKTGIGVLCHCVPRHLYEEAAAQLENVFPMDLYMKKPWE